MLLRSFFLTFNGLLLVEGKEKRENGRTIRRKQKVNNVYKPISPSIPIPISDI